MAADFPNRLAEKLRQIREHFGLSPDELAVKVGAKNGAEILAYERDAGEMLVSMFWKYVKVAGCSVEDLLEDDRDLWSTV